uniref:Colony stimulating factor 3 receptor n=1 Tax=Lepisosteus oculatus TaxID=7918 RepID=W5M5V7_LEPOC|nr:PREDICTED: granulocyte colony-stimulating factor receptor [Lepisosteus oculatus]
MASVLNLDVLVLTIMVFSTIKVTEASDCADISVQSSVVVLGSPLRASCVAKDNCTPIGRPDIQMEWRLNSIVIPESQYMNQSGGVSTVLLPNFTIPRGYLSCFLILEGQHQVADEVEIRAGYPPSKPSNLTCMTNLTKPPTFTCTWNPSSETYLPTQFILHTVSRPFETKTFVPPIGTNSYTIPRKDFHLYSKMEIFVTAVNALGNTTSDLLYLDPMDAVKLDPPVIQSVQTDKVKYGCLKIEWKISDSLSWLERFIIELRFKTTENELWTTDMINSESMEAVEQCGLLHGTEYEVQIRVRLSEGYWSDWSNTIKDVTPEKAPSGELDTWWKVLNEMENVYQLYWKPAKQFKANSQHVYYKVFQGQQRIVCNTSETQCDFQLYEATRKVYITAVNSAGESRPTLVNLNLNRALDPVLSMSVSSYEDIGFWVQWAHPESSLPTDFVIEWCAVSGKDTTCSISFKVVASNYSETIISENIEPYRPYNISVYPRYKRGIGCPIAMEGYSKQKAPSRAPKMEVRQVRDTQAELTWDEIPVDERNGIIRNYTIFYLDESNKIKSVTVQTPQSQLILDNLKPSSSYRVFIMASNDAGSINGTIIAISMRKIDSWSILSTVVPACVGLAVFILITLSACFAKQERLKLRLWPVVPDPANSSIQKWTQNEALKDKRHFQDLQDPSPVNISRFSILDVSDDVTEKGTQKAGLKPEDECWQPYSYTGDLGMPICSSSHIEKDCDHLQHKDYQNYMGEPYATVIFSEYRSQQGTTPVYLRSDSTQPLLQDLSPSPKQYENLWFSSAKEEEVVFLSNHGDEQEERVCSASWDDFPLLSRLMIKEASSQEVS